MRALISFLLLLCCMPGALAQDSTRVVSPPWKHGLIANLNVTQVSFTDWSQGGENAFAWAIFLEGKSARTDTTTEWITSYKLGFGQANIGTQGTRKTDDRIDFESVLTYKVGTIINPFLSASLKSQFAVGYAYDALGTPTPISAFFDPAYLTQTVGVGYQPLPELKTRLGGALRETIADRFAARYTYTNSDSNTVKVEGGIESVSELAWPFAENMALTSKLEMFGPLKQIDRITLRWDNTLSAKVNKYFSVTLNLLLLIQPDVSTRTQAKQTLALGIGYTLI